MSGVLLCTDRTWLPSLLAGQVTSTLTRISGLFTFLTIQNTDVTLQVVLFLLSRLHETQSLRLFRLEVE